MTNHRFYEWFLHKYIYNMDVVDGTEGNSGGDVRSDGIEAVMVGGGWE